MEVVEEWFFFQGKSTRNPGFVIIQRGGVSYHPQFPSSNYGEHELGIELGPLGYANVLEDKKRCGTKGGMRYRTRRRSV